MGRFCFEIELSFSKGTEGGEARGWKRVVRLECALESSMLILEQNPADNTAKGK